MKVTIGLEELKNLAKVSMERGTQDSFIPIALEYVDYAVAEGSRLKAVLDGKNNRIDELLNHNNSLLERAREAERKLAKWEALLVSSDIVRKLVESHIAAGVNETLLVPRIPTDDS